MFRRYRERLAEFTRLILFDKRGMGMSDRVPGGTPLDPRMDDIRAVMDAVGSESAAVMGGSEGGPRAILFAAAHPERTRALPRPVPSTMNVVRGIGPLAENASHL